MKQFTLLLAILTMFSWQSYSQTSTCDYTFDMTDSFGDGWNGATVDFVQNGLIVASQTLASGSSGTATVALDDNVTTYLIGSSAGSYSGETGFTFNDPSGVAVATLASGVGYVSGDTLATFTTVCPAPPACLDPTALSAANITDVSADLSWTDAAASGSSNVEYGVAGFALGMGTQILGTANTTESIFWITCELHTSFTYSLTVVLIKVLGLDQLHSQQMFVMLQVNVTTHSTC